VGCKAGEKIKTLAFGPGFFIVRVCRLRAVERRELVGVEAVAIKRKNPGAKAGVFAELTSN
jgi:hypothetical protein